MFDQKRGWELAQLAVDQAFPRDSSVTFPISEMACLGSPEMAEPLVLNGSYRLNNMTPW